jgi:hypothetical protein
MPSTATQSVLSALCSRVRALRVVWRCSIYSSPGIIDYDFDSLGY